MATEQKEMQASSGVPISKATSQELEHLQQLLTTLRESAEELGRFYVELVDRSPGNKARIVEQCGCTSAFWRDIENVGRGVTNPALPVSGIPHWRQIGTLPRSDQDAAIEGRTHTLAVDGPEGPDSREVSLMTATLPQMKQLIASGRVRTVGEQRAFMASEERKATLAKAPSPELPYTPNAKGLAIHEAVFITWGELMRMLATRGVKP